MTIESVFHLRPDKGHQLAYHTHVETQDDILQSARHVG